MHVAYLRYLAFMFACNGLQAFGEWSGDLETHVDATFGIKQSPFQATLDPNHPIESMATPSFSSIESWVKFFKFDNPISLRPIHSPSFFFALGCNAKKKLTTKQKLCVLANLLEMYVGNELFPTCKCNNNALSLRP